MSSILWLNGSLIPAQEARISPFDHGLLVGDGVFETLVARAGVPFAPQMHYERLRVSCEKMGLAAMPEATYLESLAAVLEANGMTEARLRVTVTSGDGPLGSERGAAAGTHLVTAAPLKPWPPTERVCLSPWTRHENGALAGVKSTSYGENVVALADARARGYGEALLANTRGELCEGTGSNVFVVVDGVLMTPPLSSGCLAGVTRRLVLASCAAAGIPCLEQALPVSLLEHCQEAFLTSSTRDVHPIERIGPRALPCPGPVTLAVQEAFHRHGVKAAR
ncbi:MAG: aminotransferase class IV [Prosthecobacter sp.]|jgi:branched-chain amino acid aminotransferase|nr:aminotransferase class IV [Prosthecobacter sp.]